VREEITKYPLMKLIGVVPHDETVYEYDAEGKPSVTVPTDSPVKVAVRRIFDQLTL
jgi:CO dehydrogenase maturation factor